MNRLVLVASLAALTLAAACSDDDAASDGNKQSNAGSAGTSGSTGGEGGSASADGGAGTGDAGSNSGGEGGSAPAPTCDPPPAPHLGAGGAAGSGGAGGAGGAGGGAGGVAPSGELAIEGSYEDDYGGSHEITSVKWTSDGSVYNLSAFDNEEQYVIARNDQGNAYNACSWSRFDWTESGGDLYFCITAYDAASEAEALETERPDDSDPENGGCSSFAWSKLTPQ